MVRKHLVESRQLRLVLGVFYMKKLLPHLMFGLRIIVRIVLAVAFPNLAVIWFVLPDSVLEAAERTTIALLDHNRKAGRRE